MVVELGDGWRTWRSRGRLADANVSICWSRLLFFSMSDLADCLFGNTIMLKCWYNGRTGRALAQEAIDQSKEKRIPFVSTPAAYRDFLKIQEESDSPINGDHVP
ncbi:hypothetical protein PF008_g16895, partial [Phytophthora fragariae]